MKFYSEKLNQLFDYEKDLQEAEAAKLKEEEEAKAAATKKREERATRAKEVEEAFAVARDAQNKANALMSAFIKDYGSFHTTIKDAIPTIWDWIFNPKF